MRCAPSSTRAGIAPSAIRTFDDIEAAFAAAREEADEADRIIVFGSFLTVAAALAAATHGNARIAMAERIADNAELLVDEMKRKARRRLVGAVVLALAAAIVLPMLLEKEPRPLGDDVSVQIPPVDEGKFVNRLTGKTGDDKALPKAESKAIAAAPGKSETKADVPGDRRAASAPPTAAQKAEPDAPPVATTEERSQRESKRDTEDEPKAESKAAAPTRPAKRTRADGRTERAVRHGSVRRQSPASPSAASAAPRCRGDAEARWLCRAARRVRRRQGRQRAREQAEEERLRRLRRAGRHVARHAMAGARRRLRLRARKRTPRASTLKGEGYSGIIAPAQ